MSSLGLILTFLPKFFYEQFFVKPAFPTQSFADQTIIVTGANVGLGFEAARHLVRLGAAKVIIACRTIEKGEAAKRDIEKTTKREGVVEVWQLDLCSYESVRQFAARANGLKRLDGLLENAGIATAIFNTAEGLESTITTNVTATFLLAFLMLPKLKETARTFNVRPRLTIVSSEVHFLTDMPERTSGRPIFETLNDKANARMMDRYNVSKLLEVFAVRQMVEDRASSPDYPVTINYLNPGLCHSELSREMGSAAVIMKAILARTTEVGSRVLVYAIGAGHDTHGQYISSSKVHQPATFVLSEEGKTTEKRVWAELSQILEKIEPHCTSNL